MKQTTGLFILLFIMSMCHTANAQDTLPRFNVRSAPNGSAIISWVNTYPVTKQISIQRSHDSLTGFKSIISIADPTAVQNGFADKTAPNDHMYYRLFINLDKGKFFFTPSRQAKRDTAKATVIKNNLPSNGPVEPNDSSVTKSEIKPQPIPKKPEWIPSVFVYTNKDGYILVNLPDADRKKYHIKFYEEDDSFLFELKNIKQPALTLDKVNFMHSGWFKFELYEEEALVEKNKFFLPKDF